MLKRRPWGQFSESPSEETLSPPKQSSRTFNQPARERPRPSFSVIPRTLDTENTTNVSITCFNCAPRGKGHWERPWRGLIVGARASGHIKALLVKIKLKYTTAPLVGLLTLCPDCCIELKLHSRLDQMNRIRNFQGVHGCAGKILLRASHEDIEELFFSQVMVLVGAFTTPFRTIGSDGQWKEWNQLGRY